MLPALVVIAVAIAVIGLGASGPIITAPNGSTQIDAANSAFELNAATSDNVYQQQVVALWGIKDMTEATAQQNKTIIGAQVQLLESQSDIFYALRATLLLLVLLICAVALLGAAWLTKSIRQRAPASTDRSETVDGAARSMGESS